MLEKGKIAVQKTKGGGYAAAIRFSNNKNMPLPPFYILRDAGLDGVECEVEREKGQIKRVLVAGQELPRRPEKGARAGDQGRRPPDRQQQAAGQPSLKNAGHPQTGHPQVKIGENEWLKVFLPCDTRRYLPASIDNFGLLLNKVARLDDREDEKGQGKGFKFFLSGKTPRSLLEADFAAIDFPGLARRQERALRGTGLNLLKIPAQPQWRFVIGLGQESVYETSLTLHPVYGFPFIPGSAVKGLVRNTIISQVFAGDEKQAVADTGFRALFGWSNYVTPAGSHKGLIHFFDAYPTKGPEIVPDIINPHYAPYYQDSSGRTPPGDYYNPVPVFFLAVEKTAMLFYLGIKPEANQVITAGALAGEDYLSTAGKWLRLALAEYGIGAKTAVGYGYFTSL